MNPNYTTYSNSSRITLIGEFGSLGWVADNTVNNSPTNVNELDLSIGTQAEKLSTARTIWGQSFDGSGNVSGGLTGVGSITMNGNIRNTTYGTGTYNIMNWDFSNGHYEFEFPNTTDEYNGSHVPIYIGWRGGIYPIALAANTNVGIGTTNPAYKLDVNGTINGTTVYSNGFEVITTSNISQQSVASAATAANASKLGGYAALAFALASHTHSSIVTEGDNRSVSTTPSEYVSDMRFRGLKSASTIGLTQSSTYAYLLGLKGWNDYSGGAAHELAFSNNGLFHRTGNTDGTDAWGDWEQIVTKTMNGTLSVGSIISGTLSGTTASGGGVTSYGGNVMVYGTAQGSSQTNIRVWLETTGQIGFSYVAGAAYIKLGSQNELTYYVNTTGSPQHHFKQKILCDGSCTATSHPTSSDIRLKDVYDYNALVAVDTIASAPAIRFTWKNSEDKKLHCGTIAQYWQTVMSECVEQGSDGYLAMQYDVIALLAAISIAKKVTDHEERITELEKENKRLKKELEQLKAA